MSHLEPAELLLARRGLCCNPFDAENVEADSLGQRAALANCDDIAFVDTEARRAVHGHVLVSLLETVVLADVVKVVTTDNDRALHLDRLDDTRQEAAADGDVSGEGALLVDVGTLHGLLGRLEAHADILEVVRPRGLALLADNTANALEDGRLLLERLLNTCSMWADDMVAERQAMCWRNPWRTPRTPWHI